MRRRKRRASCSGPGVISRGCLFLVTKRRDLGGSRLIRRYDVGTQGNSDPEGGLSVLFARRSAVFWRWNLATDDGMGKVV